MDTNENRKDKVMKLKCVEVYEGLYHQEPFDVALPLSNKPIRSAYRSPVR